VYLELYDQIPAPLTRHSWGQRQSDESLVDILWRIQERPAIYFGNGFRFLQVWAFCSGFRWAERDASVQDSLSEPLFAGLSEWLEDRYPFSRGIPWHRLFHALALGNASWAFTSFMEHLGLYLAGERPDAQDPTMKKMLSNIQAHLAKPGHAELPGAADGGRDPGLS
jgi:hypothetical protein